MKTLPHNHIYDDFDAMNKAFEKLQRTLVELQDLSSKVSAGASVNDKGQSPGVNDKGKVAESKGLSSW